MQVENSCGAAKITNPSQTCIFRDIVTMVIDRGIAIKGEPVVTVGARTLARDDPLQSDLADDPRCRGYLRW